VEDARHCKGDAFAHVLWLDDGSIQMFYTSQGADGSTTIGGAKCECGDMGGGDYVFGNDISDTCEEEIFVFGFGDVWITGSLAMRRTERVGMIIWIAIRVATMNSR